MNRYLYTAGKGFTILTGFTLFAHSRFMPTNLKTYMNPHSFLKNDGETTKKSNVDNYHSNYESEFMIDNRELNENPPYIPTEECEGKN